MRYLIGSLIVFLGGGVGATLRHCVNLAFARWVGTTLPFHTVFENVTGSFAMGLLAGYFAFKGHLSQEIRLFLITGVLGGYTTFSAFSLDFALMWERHQFCTAVVYLVLSVAASIGGLMLGLIVVRL
jgi:CrcB protein